MKGFFLLLSFFGFVVSYSQKQSIQLNLTVGKTYAHDQKSKSVVLQTVNGKLNQTTVEMSAKTNYYVGSVHDSVYNMMVSYEKLVTKTNTDQGETESVSDGSKQDIVSKVFQAFVNKPFPLVMTKTGRVLEIHSDTILSVAVNQIDGLTEQQKEIITENLKKTIGGNAIKGNFEILTAIYPFTPVGLNDSWATRTQLQSMTMINLEGDYTLKDVQPGHYQLHGEINMISAKQDSATKIGGMPLYFDLSGKMTADLLLDKTTGWISSGTISQSLKGEIKFLDSEQVPGGMDVPASVATEMSLGEKSQGSVSMTAEKVIHRYIEVSGGEKLLNSLKSTQAIAEGVLNGDSVVITILKVVPFKTYMKYETAHNGTIESIYNNRKVIFKKDGKVMPVVDSSGIEDLEVHSFLLADMAYQKLGYKMDLIPSDEDSTYRVQLTSPKGRITIKYFSKKTGYLTKGVFAEGTASYFYDFEKVGGFLVNRREIIINRQGNPEEIRLTKFVLNPKYDPSIFNF
jgi:hypothetical protein